MTPPWIIAIVAIAIYSLYWAVKLLFMMATKPRKELQLAIQIVNQVVVYQKGIPDTPISYACNVALFILGELPRKFLIDRLMEPWTVDYVTPHHPGPRSVKYRLDNLDVIQIVETAEKYRKVK